MHAIGSVELDGRTTVAEPCLTCVLYGVLGDTFFVQGSTARTVDLGLREAPSRPAGPSAGALARCALFKGYDGLASLFWDGELVDEAVIDQAFVLGFGTAVLSFNAPTGDRYEYHVYSRPQCKGVLPRGPATRAMVEDSEL